MAEGRGRYLPFPALKPAFASLVVASLGGAGVWAWLDESGPWRAYDAASELPASAPGALGGLLLAWAAWLAWQGAAPGLRAWRLARQGRLVPGEVVFCSGIRSEDGSLVVNMKYRFKTPDGRALEAVQRFAGRDLPSETLPPSRTSLVVYYASDDCYQVL